LSVLITLSCISVSSAMVACKQNEVDDCIAPFVVHYNNGVEALKDANKTSIMEACWKFEVVRSCIIPLMYYCPEIKRQLRDKIEGFEYLCSRKNSADGWPFIPTFKAYAGDKEKGEDSGYETHTEAKVRRDTVESAIKASIAAAVTVMLVLVCVTADCVSKWKIRRRVSKAKEAAQTQTEQPLIQKQGNETDEEARTGQKQV